MIINKYQSVHNKVGLAQIAIDLISIFEFVPLENVAMVKLSVQVFLVINI